MGIVDTSFLNEQAPETPSPEEILAQKQAATAAFIRRTSTLLYQNMINTFQDNYLQIWRNPLGLTPQQAFDSLEGDAADIFDNGVDLLTIVLKFNQSAVPAHMLSSPENYTVEINSDGTVTATLQDSSSSASSVSSESLESGE